LSLVVSPGLTFVLGGDGRGKTTLLRLLAGDLAADAGEFSIHGVTLQTHTKDYRQQLFWTEPRTDALDQMTPAHYFDV
jgi:ABC-type multidrug transport system ATPase subunit